MPRSGTYPWWSSASTPAPTKAHSQATAFWIFGASPHREWCSPSHCFASSTNKFKGGGPRCDAFTPRKNGVHMTKARSSFLTKIHSSRMRIRLITARSQTEFLAVLRELSRSAGTRGKLFIDGAELIPSGWGKRRTVSNSMGYEVEMGNGPGGSELAMVGISSAKTTERPLESNNQSKC